MSTWLLMLTVGVIHAEILPAVYPAGFNDLLWIVLLITLVKYYSIALIGAVGD